MALASGTSRPLIGRLPGTARPHVSSSSASSIRFPGGRAVSLRASAPPAAATPGRSPKSLLVLLSFDRGSAAATTAMLSAAASAIPRIRWAAPPRHSSSRTQWLLQRRRTLSSSSSNVTPAAAAGSGAGALEPPDLPRLADAARISLSPQEAEEFAPKIRQMVDWFGQLQAVDLKSIEPSLRAGTVAGSSLREDKPEAFANRDAIVEAVPSYDDPYIKVPRVLNKE